ncbi:hypothetical protein HY604_01170 [Candidatus Peregrinibacteria bacterium]|nr:hypothetical protein [Candidatus Peregrinibacteria bacterium]
MNLSYNKNYLLMILSGILFLAASSFASMIYFKMDDPVDEKKYDVEVNLPIVNWDHYLKLSKQR